MGMVSGRKARKTAAMTAESPRRPMAHFHEVRAFCIRISPFGKIAIIDLPIKYAVLPGLSREKPNFTASRKPLFWQAIPERRLAAFPPGVWPEVQEEIR